MKVIKLFVLVVMFLTIFVVSGSQSKVANVRASYNKYQVESAARSALDRANFLSNGKMTSDEIKVIAEGIAAGIEAYDRTNK